MRGTNRRRAERPGGDSGDSQPYPEFSSDELDEVENDRPTPFGLRVLAWLGRLPGPALLLLVLVVLAGGIVWLWVVANNGLSASTGADPAGTFAFFILLLLVAGGVGLWRGRR